MQSSAAIVLAHGNIPSQTKELPSCQFHIFQQVNARKLMNMTREFNAAKKYTRERFFCVHSCAKSQVVNAPPPAMIVAASTTIATIANIARAINGSIVGGI